MTYEELLDQILNKYDLWVRDAPDGDKEIIIPYGERVSGLLRDLERIGFIVIPTVSEDKIFRIWHIYPPVKARFLGPEKWDAVIGTEGEERIRRYLER
jgi:hypothetical protein